MMVATVLQVAMALVSVAPAPPAGQGSGGTALVLSLPGDPYDALAREIAEAESLPLVSALDDAADRATGARLPLHVLWVAAPSRLSDEVMTATGRFLERHPELVVGIITGSTQEDARALWRRASEARGDRVAYALGTQPGSGLGIPEELVSDGPRGRATRPLTRDSFLEALTASDYVTFSGHGGSTYLRLTDTARVEADDLPSLPPVVVATASCNTLRPWVGRSLALAFVDRGAAAYVGFTYSPMSGYLLGQYRDLAYRYSWPGFTVGQIVGLQSRGTLKGFAAFPYYFLLGDPRLRLRKTAPYRIVMDHSAAEGRVVTIEGPTDGVLPVRIPGGAGYPFLRVPGVGSIWEGDRFYNAHLQMENVGADKLVLIVRGARDDDAVEPLAIFLSREPPRRRLLTRSVTDALDHTFLFLPQTGTLPAPAIGLVTLLLVLGWGGWAARLGPDGAARWSRLLVAALAGAAGFLLLGLYGWARADGVAITSKVVTPLLTDALDFGLVVAAGAYLFLVSRSWKGQAVAVLIGTAPALVPAVITMTVLWLTNVQMRARLGTSVYSYHMAYLSIISTVVWLPVVLVLFWLAGRVSASGRGARTIA